MFKSNYIYEILTPNGFQPFKGISIKHALSVLTIYLENGNKISCSENHLLKTDHGFKKAQDLKLQDKIDTSSGFYGITNISINAGKSVLLFDPVNTGTKNEYYANGIVNHNCEFLGTGETYIDGEILRSLHDNANPDYWIKYNNRMRVWKDPEPHHEYAIGVDCSIGRGRDHSSFHVFDLYNGEQVAEFYSNRTPINEFARIIADEGRLYNIAFVLPERNTIGNNLIFFLKEECEYENLVMDDKREIGIQVTQKNRESLLVDMETAIRSSRLKINSERLVKELFTFVIDPDTGKVEADANCHDDLIMALALTVKIYNDIVGTTPIERDTLIDNINIPVSNVFKYKYNMRTATGGITEEDIKWLLKD